MKKNIIYYAVTIILGLALAYFILLSKDVFSETRLVEVFGALSDAFFVPGVVFVSVGLLAVASNGGLFRMLGYAMNMLINAFRTDVSKRKYKDFYEYKEAKKGKKLSVSFILYVGIGYILVALVFMILYLNI